MSPYDLRKKRKITHPRKLQRSQKKASEKATDVVTCALDIGTSVSDAQYMVKIGGWQSKHHHVVFDPLDSATSDKFVREIPTKIAVWVDRRTPRQLQWGLPSDRKNKSDTFYISRLKRGVGDRIKGLYTPAVSAIDTDCKDAVEGLQNFYKGDEKLEDLITPITALKQYLALIVKRVKDQFMNPSEDDPEYTTRCRGKKSQDFRFRLRIGVPSDFQGTTRGAFLGFAKQEGVDEVDDGYEISSIKIAVANDSQLRERLEVSVQLKSGPRIRC